MSKQIGFNKPTGGGHFAMRDLALSQSVAAKHLRRIQRTGDNGNQ